MSAGFLRRFARWNIWFWMANLAVTDVLYVADKATYQQLAILYLNNISIIALVLSSLSWWQSCRVEVKEDER